MPKLRGVLSGALCPLVVSTLLLAACASTEAPAACVTGSDCPSGVCTSANECGPPATDGTKNGEETDVDCGGSAPKCAPAKSCKVGADCTSGVCKDVGQGIKCQWPLPTDTVKNGEETDVDCGGATAPKCDDEKACAKPEDCKNGICSQNVCKAFVCDDQLKNGTETDVDCGGANCPPCADLKACTVATDCASGVCGDVGGAKQCLVPTPTDEVKNGTETDVDCGGAADNPRCAAGKGCVAHGDCESDGCGYDKKCAVKRSCTLHNGGDTCGSGGAGATGAAKWESCCETAPAGPGGVEMNKYQVTSGRMRAFLERVKGNVRQVVKDAREAGELHGAAMDASYDAFLPTSMEGCGSEAECAGEITDTPYADPGNPIPGIFTSAYRHLGGTMFNGQSLPTQGCAIDSPGTHTYWMSPEVQAGYFGDSPAEHPQDVYDTKSLNCVNYLMAQSFCIWDGGRLETQAEFRAAGGSADYDGLIGQPPPWGTPTPKGQGDNTFFEMRFPTATDESLGLPAGSSIEWANYLYSYEYPNLKANDFVVFIAAPGRHKYRSANGHADLVGNIMEMTNDVNANTGDPRTTASRWSANGSWEGHQWGFYKWNFTLVNKYGKQGLRCVYP